MLAYPLLNYKNQTGDDSMNGPGIDGSVIITRLHHRVNTQGRRAFQCRLDDSDAPTPFRS